ncbi:hypothetical protein AB0C07_28905 [Actinoplanes missouriensis]|uniref:hypothetical protein n=1 Tax=Actinoplanes missouriensis TaxID=1866 RepID=UPI0033D8F03B
MATLAATFGQAWSKRWEWLLRIVVLVALGADLALSILLIWGAAVSGSPTWVTVGLVMLLTLVIGAGVVLLIGRTGRPVATLTSLLAAISAQLVLTFAVIVGTSETLFDAGGVMAPAPRPTGVTAMARDYVTDPALVVAGDGKLELCGESPDECPYTRPIASINSAALDVGLYNSGTGPEPAAGRFTIRLEQVRPVPARSVRGCTTVSPVLADSYPAADRTFTVTPHEPTLSIAAEDVFGSPAQVPGSASPMFRVVIGSRIPDFVDICAAGTLYRWTVTDRWRTGSDASATPSPSSSRRSAADTSGLVAVWD